MGSVLVPNAVREMLGKEEDAFGGSEDRFMDFERQDDGSTLDHLVPADIRVEPALRDQGQQLLIKPEEKGEWIHKMHLGCHLVEQAVLTQRQWSVQACNLLLQELYHLVQEHTPKAVHYEIRNAVMERINSLVRPGLMQYNGMYVAHYGSFTSGLFAPDGDLDIAIEGVLQQRENVQKNDSHRHLENAHGVNVSDLAKHEKAALLRALCRKITNQQMASHGAIERVLHARVPIIKFVDQKSGIPCDVAVGSGGARFKSTVLRHLAQIDARFQGLMRLVKRWAHAWHLNDASNGTFNTFALTNMVVFHLQTRQPPILPALCDLFDLPADAIEDRPLHLGQPAEPGLLEVCERRAAAWRGESNPASLLDLLASFFAQFSNAIAVWTNDTSAGQLSRAVRVSAWAGGWSFMEWPKRYLVPVEDPFDATDNCARSVMATRIDHVRDSFRLSLQTMMQLQDGADVQHTLSSLFVKQEQPNFRSLGFGDRRDRRIMTKNENGGAGRGRGGGQAHANRDPARAQGLWRAKSSQSEEEASSGNGQINRKERRAAATAAAQLRPVPPVDNARQWAPVDRNPAVAYAQAEAGSRDRPRNVASGGDANMAGGEPIAVAAQRSKDLRQPRAVAATAAGHSSTPIAAVSPAVPPPGFMAAAPRPPPGFALPASAGMLPQGPPPLPARKGSKPIAPPPGWPSGTAGGALSAHQQQEQQQQVVPKAATVTSPSSWQDQFLRRSPQGGSAAAGDVGSINMNALAAGLPDSLDLSPSELQPQRKPQRGGKVGGPPPTYDPFQHSGAVAAPQTQEITDQPPVEGASADAELAPGKRPNGKVRFAQRVLAKQRSGESEPWSPKWTRKHSGSGSGVQVEEVKLTTVAGEGSLTAAAPADDAGEGKRRKQKRRGKKERQGARLVADSTPIDGSGDRRAPSKSAQAASPSSGDAGVGGGLRSLQATHTAGTQEVAPLPRRAIAQDSQHPPSNSRPAHAGRGGRRGHGTETQSRFAQPQD